MHLQQFGNVKCLHDVVMGQRYRQVWLAVPADWAQSRHFLLRRKWARGEHYTGKGALHLTSKVAAIPRVTFPVKLARTMVLLWLAEPRSLRTRLPFEKHTKRACVPVLRHEDHLLPGGSTLWKRSNS